MTTAEDIQSILQREANAILNIPISDAFEKAISLIVEQVHRKKGKLVTSGMGKAGQIAMNIATTFCSTGIPSVFLHPSEAQHGDLGVLQENDLMLVISNSGKTREILELLVLASRLQPDLRFIVITGNPDSQLAQSADVWSSGRSLSVRPHSDDFDNSHDCYRRHISRRHYESNRIRQQPIRTKASRRIFGTTFTGTIL